jgi:hypothetical protein
MLSTTILVTDTANQISWEVTNTASEVIDTHGIGDRYGVL